jgi:hypothetical protein
MKHKNPNMGHLVSLIASNGGSQKAQDFFWTMTDRARKKWDPRYQAILARKGSTLKPPMTWWEREFDQAMKLGTSIPSKSQRLQ